ncbi:MAG: HTTM domain-containing protein, partial [Verrucomicrobiota bacterium]
MWERWLRCLEHREGAEALALCRMMAGLGLLGSVLVIVPHGMVGILWTDESHGGYRSLGEDKSSLLAWCLVAGCFVAGIGLVLGWRSRWMAFAGLAGWNAIIHLNPHDGSAYDSLLTNQLLLLGLSGAGVTCSLDARREEGSWLSSREIPQWPRAVMVVQLLVCYVSTGVQKIGSQWLPGGDLSALHYVLQDPFWARWNLSPVLEQASAMGVTQVGTGLSWWFEVLAPLWGVAVWRRFRGPETRWGWRVAFWG